MREHKRHEIRAYCADLADPPRELDSRYDGVLGFFILHHLVDLNAAFAGVARMVRPGGTIAFIEPNPANPLYYIQIGCTPGMKWKAERGIRNMRERILLPALANAGFVDCTVFRFGFLPPFLRNRAFGGAIDRSAERMSFLEPYLPFQIFGATKPKGN